jgi:DNA-binding transcriptional LysR family regulator
MDDWSAVLAPQLRALTELAAHDGHMTQAAAALGIPQSSMSRRIHSLEATLRIPLLIRDGRAVRLTPAATTLVQKARDALRELDAALTDLVSDADPDTGTVRFGFPLTMGSGAIPDLLAAFRRKHPGILLQLKQAHGSALIDDLRSGILDLAITIPPPTDLHHTILATQEICLVISDRHPLARTSTVKLAELRDETFIANPLSYNLRQLTEQWCRKVGYVPDVAVEITEFAMIRELIDRELGVALLPRSERPLPGTVEISLHDGPYNRDISLTWATPNPTAVAKRFASFILYRDIGKQQL